VAALAACASIGASTDVARGSELGAAAPLTLPPVAATSREPETPRWIVGARPGRATAALARRYGGRPLGSGAYALPRTHARAFAGRLGEAGALVYAEPDSVASAALAPPPDPLSGRARWRDAVVDPVLDPPAVTAQSPLLGLIDSALDLSHPEFQGASVRRLRQTAVRDFGGTATASVAAAPANGVGILGIWPGMRVANSPLPGATGISCSQVTRAIRDAVAAGAAVIAMGYGFEPTQDEAGSACFSQYVALQEAVRKGILPVASAGITTSQGTELDEPASLPHVVSVAAVDASLQPASFMLADPTIDLAAPGVGVVAAVPVGFDRDGTADGYRAISGTALPSSMAAAAAAWLRAVEPSLSTDQIAAKLRGGARDLAGPGHDDLTGYGFLRLAEALAADPPEADPREPNEDIGWVSGRHLRPAQRSVRLGGRVQAITATLDGYDDPHDVYPVRVGARDVMRISLRRHEGVIGLGAYDQSAADIQDRRRRLARLGARAAKTESLQVRNPRSRARTVYVHVYGVRERGARYTLRLARR